MVSPHITIPEKVDKIIRDYAYENNLKYSQAVAQLLESGVTNIELNKAVNINNALMDKLYYKFDYTTKLLEELFAYIMDDGLMDLKKSNALKEFKKKYNFYINSID